MSPTPERRLPRIQGGTPLLLLVCLVIFVDSLGYGVVVPVLPLYAKNLGISDFQLSLLFATYAIALLAGATLVYSFLLLALTVPVLILLREDRAD